ncbi:MAG TPA: DUF86 domain-containing protein [Spirochaetota bacterium]|nr:DUF86 domain-containing protein [Spirochaetota bacterium]
MTRINEEYQGIEDNLYDFTKQDSIILNIQRSCELSIDLSNLIISKYGFTIPKNSRESFEILNENGIIDKDLLEIMKKMIGFRNIAIHNYKILNVSILKSIIDNNLKDFLLFIESIMKILKSKNAP